jgi:hypothetical protein
MRQDIRESSDVKNPVADGRKGSGQSMTWNGTRNVSMANSQIGAPRRCICVLARIVGEVPKSGRVWTTSVNICAASIRRRTPKSS